MRAIVIHKAKDLRIEEVDQETPKAGEVLIRLSAGGVCGSDLHYYQHGGFGAITLKEPMILGHEVSGVVEELGADVTGLAKGAYSRCVSRDAGGGCRAMCCCKWIDSRGGGDGGAAFCLSSCHATGR